MTHPMTTLEVTGGTALDLASAPSSAPSRLVVAEGLPGLDRGRLEAEVRARLAEWGGASLDSPGVAVVKRTRRRVVLRFEARAPLPAVYVKQERILGIWNGLRSLAAPSHASLEFENAVRLARMEIAAPRPVAFAEWRTGPVLRRSVSVLEELRGGLRIDEYFQSVPKDRRFEAIETVARALAQLHARGVDLTDCHRGNLLAFQGDGAAAARVALLDVAAVRFAPVGARARIERVGQLTHSLWESTTFDERRAFVERYAREAALSHSALDGFAREVRAAEQRIHATRERSRDRRCVLDSTEFYVRRGPRRRVWARREVTPEEIAFFGGIGKSLAELTARGAKVVKEEGRNECFVVERDGKARFVKRVRASSLFGAIVDAVRGSRGKRAWRAAHALARRKIATPRALALVEEGFLVPMRSTLIVDFVPGARNLGEVAASFATNPPGRAARRRLLDALGRFVGALHNDDVDHDDLAIKNFLLVAGDDPQLSVIDLDAVAGWYAPLSRERILRALMQLDDAPRGVSRADRMRVLAAYEKATNTRYTRSDLAEVRRMLRERFARSKRDYAATGPR